MAASETLSGQYHWEKRVLSDIEAIRDGTVVAKYRAMNDTVINKGSLARIIQLGI
jgi:hypothetical protein